jgi:hypothetical protein
VEVEVTGRSISLTIVAFLLGALSAGGVGVRVIREVRTAEDATSLPAENIAPTQDGTAEYQVDPYESLISSTALVPTSATAEAGDIAIAYDLVSLAPSLGVEAVQISPGEDPGHVSGVYPRRWVIETESGPVEGGPEDQGARVARFDADRPLTTADIESVRIVEALAPFAFEKAVSLSETEPHVEVAPGVSVELVKISDEGSATIVQVAVRPNDSFARGVIVSGDGPGWSSSAQQADGASTFTLRLSGGARSDDFRIVVSGTAWVELDGPFDVNLDDVR